MVSFDPNSILNLNEAVTAMCLNEQNNTITIETISLEEQEAEKIMIVTLAVIFILGIVSFTIKGDIDYQDIHLFGDEHDPFRPYAHRINGR